MTILSRSFYALICITFTLTGTATAQVVVDNDDGAPAYVETGSWTTSSSTGYDGSTYRFASPGSAATATWTANISEAGDYELFVWYIASSNRPTAARYDIAAADGTHTVYVNQQQGGYAWESLGTFTLSAGNNTITLDAAGSTGGTAVIADAVRFGDSTDPPIDPPTPVEVAPGVFHSTWELPTPQVLHVVEFDLADKRYDLQMGLAHGKRNFPAKQITSQIAEEYDTAGNNVVAAINASHFGSDIYIFGTQANNGNLIGLPTLSWAMEGYVLQESNSAFAISYIPGADTVVRFADGAELPADTFNYTCESGNLAIWTTDWNSSTGSTAQGVEVIVENVNYPWRANKWMTGRITDIRTGTASIDNPIPANGFVLGACSGMESALLSHVSIGDEINARITLSPAELNNAKVICAGASGQLVKDGEPYTENWTYDHAPVRHPRTALAWSGTKHWFVTCDGRQSGYSVGMTYAELADFLIDALGADYAINLDGGGSTTMVINDDVVNCPSDGASSPCTGNERPVPNAMLLIERDRESSMPVADEFPSTGREIHWDDKFSANPVAPADPSSPSGDGYSVLVSNPEGGMETIATGTIADQNYTVSADIYCEYRPEVAADGYERLGLFARDSGDALFDSTTLGGGNCYAITCDSNDGRLRAGKFINGVFTDFLTTPIYATTSAWRSFKLHCQDSQISFFIDDVEVASVNDDTHPYGRMGIAYHEYFVNDANAKGTRADNFYAFSWDFDYNDDGCVDNSDYAAFGYCLQGPDMTFTVNHFCTVMDGDGDLDVDLADFAIFQYLFTGDCN